MTHTAWRGDGDGIPRFGRKAQAWLRRRIRAALFSPSNNPECPWTFVKDEQDWDDTAVEILLDWYLQDPRRYVQWVDADEWRGSGFANGHWALNLTTIAKDSRTAVELVDRTLDNEACPTLDDWLQADREGTLFYAGAPSGLTLAIPEIQAQVAARAVRAQCRDCGTTFHPERSNAVHCPSCCAAHRTERESRRGRVR